MNNQADPTDPMHGIVKVHNQAVQRATTAAFHPDAPVEPEVAP